MNTQTNQRELKEIIAQKTELPFDIVDAFVDQLFLKIRNAILDESYLKLEGLGLFRVLKSGDSYRILFIGSKQSDIQTPNIAEFDKKIDHPNEKEDTILDSHKHDINKDIDIIDTSEANTEEDEVIVDDSKSANFTDKKLFFEEIPQPLIFEEAILENEQNGPDFSGNNISDVNDLIYIPSKKKKFKTKTLAITIIFLAIVAIAIIVFGIQKKKENFIYKSNFVELENSDPTNFSFIIIPESDVSLEYVSKIYYGSVDFWPYIYNANLDFVNDHLLVQSGSIIKIPKIMIDIIDYQNGSAILEAKNLGEQIRKEKKIN